MERKTVAGGITLKADGSGGGTAIFSTFNVVDSDRDVTLPNAFIDGAEAVMSAYGHSSWEGVLPVGKGVIRTTARDARFEFELFDTTAGRDTRTVLAQLGPLGQWSYGFNVTKESFGEFEGQSVRFLEGLDVFEVSPVLLGAGVGTRTLAMKRQAALSPADLSVLAKSRDIVREYRAEQAARDADASAFLRDLAGRHGLDPAVVACDRIVDGSTYKGSAVQVVDASRVPLDTRRAAEATAKTAAAHLGIPAPGVRWFVQPGEPTLWGRAFPGHGVFYVNAAADGVQATLTAAHEVAHLAGRDEDSARAYEDEFIREVLG